MFEINIIKNDLVDFKNYFDKFFLLIFFAILVNTSIFIWGCHLKTKVHDWAGSNNKLEAEDEQSILNMYNNLSGEE